MEFADLEKVRVKIIKEKIETGLKDFENRPGIQWTSLPLEKPLLESLLKIIQENESMKAELIHLRAVSENCECENYY